MTWQFIAARTATSVFPSVTQAVRRIKRRRKSMTKRKPSGTSNSIFMMAYIISVTNQSGSGISFEKKYNGNKV